VLCFNKAQSTGVPTEPGVPQAYLEGWEEARLDESWLMESDAGAASLVMRK